MYELQALIGPEDSLRNGSEHLASRRLVRLGSGLSLLPVTEQLRAELDSVRDAPRTRGFEELSAGVEDLVVEVSARSRVAYVEAVYFGGQGAQAAAVFESRRLLLGPLLGKGTGVKSPISLALHTLGVQATAGLDEFDTIGLGRHRSTRDWAQEKSKAR